jgi:thiol-disulfide isomerase/thioredoxin
LKDLGLDKKICLAFWLALVAVGAFAQDSLRISGQLRNNTRFAKVVVQKFGLGVFEVVAVPVHPETGAFTITAPADVAPGIYRLQFSQTGSDAYVDVIVNGQEPTINFSVDVAALPAVPVFTQSEENKAWWGFHAQQQARLYKLRVQEAFLKDYPDQADNSYVVLQRAYEKAKSEYLGTQKAFIHNTPFYWAKSLAQFQNGFFPKLNDHPLLQAYAAHQAFWEGKPTADTLLINTPLYTEAILGYLDYYLNPDRGLSEAEQQKGLKKCVDTIIQKFGSNEDTKTFAIKYLQMGFKEIGMEEVLQYIDQTYAAKQCSNPDEALLNRLKGYEAIKPGNQVPDFVLSRGTGNSKAESLYQVKAAQTVLFFWASWCPHCMEEMPKLNEWVEAHQEIKIIAVGLDTDSVVYTDVIKRFPNMIHSCDFKAWDTDAATKYYIAATPTFILLDQDKKIIGKYSGFSSMILAADLHTSQD